MRFPRVSIIILNWNSWRDTIECLESLYRITYPNYDVIVVDNGSKDDSVQKIKEYCEGKIEVNSKFFKYDPNNKPIKVFEISEDEARIGRFNRPLYEKFDSDRRLILIKNKDNYGFAGGHNIGIKFALRCLNSNYILLLNNDTVVDPNFLTEMMNIVLDYKDIGICGPKIYYYDEPRRIWRAGGDFNFWIGMVKGKGADEIDHGQYNRISEEKFVDGCCMLVSREVLTKVGLLDETFFFGFEDVDICIRATKSGFKVLYVFKSKIWHKVSVSAKKSPFVYIKSIESRLKLLKKHCSKLQFISGSAFYLFQLLINSFLLILKLDKNKLKFYWKGFKDYILKALL